MADEAVIAHFDGDKAALVAGYREAVRRDGRRSGTDVPIAAHLLSTERGIAAVLLWPDPPGHEPFGLFMQTQLDEVGLPFPRVEHLSVESVSWADLSSET